MLSSEGIVESANERIQKYRMGDVLISVRVCGMKGNFKISRGENHRDIKQIPSV